MRARRRRDRPDRAARPHRAAAGRRRSNNPQLRAAVETARPLVAAGELKTLASAAGATSPGQRADEDALHSPAATVGAGRTASLPTAAPWLRNPRNVTDRQSARLHELLRLPLATGRAYRWMLRFDGVYEIADPDEATDYLRRFTRGARRSRLQPIIDFARMVDEYWLGIARWWHSRISNGLLEELHSLVQAAKRRAGGYRSTQNYIAMIHLNAGKLDVAVTHTK